MVVVVELAVVVVVVLVVAVMAAAAAATEALGEFTGSGDGKNVIFTCLFLLDAGVRLRSFDRFLIAFFAIAGKLPTVYNPQYIRICCGQH